MINNNRVSSAEKSSNKLEHSPGARSLTDRNTNLDA